MIPQHDPTEFPEPTYKEAVEGWQHCQTVNAQLLEALEEMFIIATEDGTREVTIREAEAIINARTAITAANASHPA